ncbi:trafficking protein particle complex subunit 13-like isoform X1 [Gossypium australe]|uniref:Trafficking protein particle complex subunit 13-like isoform X1 n=1 Tax=Gossypium australe TaxID=47621 RepID=A0A5B6WCH5_9ROSI|nr:trafficking protein particle complex subunit 13-like isoform X1 [Gossypium australe]
MSTTPQGIHSLVFRVMRLCKPSFHVEPPFRLDPSDLFVGEDIFDNPLAASNLSPLLSSHVNKFTDSSDMTFANRFLLHHPSDAMGFSGLLVLPQSFGAIYLGETFCSYISINNSSNFEVKDVIIKAEIQTERERILLLDTSKSPVGTIHAGGHYDFIVEHDVKELGAYTMVCTALYNDGDGERKYLPQFFKFVVANPLSVRTKVRTVKNQSAQMCMCPSVATCKSVFAILFPPQETTYLEACIENHTKSNLYVDQVEFEPAPHWTAKILKADELHPADNSLTGEIVKPPILVRSGGGIHNYLYQMKISSPGSEQVKAKRSSILGKLQISWRTNLGEPGRLQTQQIVGTPSSCKEIELQVMGIPSLIILDKPFSVHLNLTNHTDRELGPFEVWLSKNSAHEKFVMFNGLQTMVIDLIDFLH